MPMRPASVRYNDEDFVAVQTTPAEDVIRHAPLRNPGKQDLIMSPPADKLP